MTTRQTEAQPAPTVSQTLASAAEAIDRLRENIARVFIGNPQAIDRLVACLLARGHVLIEDVPGVGKTVLATALARSVDCSFSRIQLTPDMLPGDILGVSVLTRRSGENGAHGAPSFEFKPGPIFANIVLADEINRTTPRTQSALLESMQEATVSVDGRMHVLEQPFMVIATQNPYEYEGTYLLPENQLDRFLMRVTVGYPSPEDEARVLTLRPAQQALQQLQAVMDRDTVLALQNATDAVRLDESLIRYIIAIAAATRKHAELHVGLSTRGTLALAQAARATAVLQGRDYVIPDDIYTCVVPVVGHRVVSSAFLQSGDTTSGAQIVEHVLNTVPSPD
ncbi:MAG: AAA family ATPase [Phycisphaerales bacterium]|nr:AAA family ATPase [Phycisphaerales bacterium]